MPTTDHWAAALGVVSCLKGTAHLKLHLGGGSTKLLGYSDADWAGDVDSRLSTTGWVFLLGGAVISWSSKRQELVATSTAESEFTSLPRRRLCDEGLSVVSIGRILHCCLPVRHAITAACLAAGGACRSATYAGGRRFVCAVLAARL